LQNFRPGKNIDPDFENRQPFPAEFFQTAAQRIQPYVAVLGIR